MTCIARLGLHELSILFVGRIIWDLAGAEDLIGILPLLGREPECTAVFWEELDPPVPFWVATTRFMLGSCFTWNGRFNRLLRLWLQKSIHKPSTELPTLLLVSTLIRFPGAVSVASRFIMLNPFLAVPKRSLPRWLVSRRNPCPEFSRDQAPVALMRHMKKPEGWIIKGDNLVSGLRNAYRTFHDPFFGHLSLTNSYRLCRHSLN